MRGAHPVRLRDSPEPPDRGPTKPVVDGSVEPLPDALSTSRLRRRLAELAAVGIVIGIVVLSGPGLGELRTRLEHASLGWQLAGVAFEVLSALSYVVIFRTVFCPRMSWRLSYQIGMSEQGANSVLSVSGAGGLALGARALHRGGMSPDRIGRKSVAVFFLTSVANVAGVIAFAALFLTGALSGDRDPALTYGLGAAALLATALVLALPRGSGRVLRSRLHPRTRGGSRPPGDSPATRSHEDYATRSDCCAAARPAS